MMRCGKLLSSKPLNNLLNILSSLYPHVTPCYTTCRVLQRAGHANAATAGRALVQLKVVEPPEEGSGGWNTRPQRETGLLSGRKCGSGR